MPHEAGPHAATWTCWPFDDQEWRGQLEGAREEYAAFLNRLCRYEPVHLLCADEASLQDVLGRIEPELQQQLHCHRVDLDDVWFRDHGPTFVVDPSFRVAPICWTFNAWGQKFEHRLDALAARELCARQGWRYFDSSVVLEGGALESNGQGTILTTRSCLFNPKRNPGWTQTDYEQLLRDYLGADQIVWLEAGLIGDHTDGHIDTLTRFTSTSQVVTCVCSRQDPNFEQLERNRRVLLGAELEVVELPIPARARWFEGARLPETYANFYLANGAVLVPQYGDPQDSEALTILALAFPDRVVEGLASTSIITSGGSFHCLTQQQPAGEVTCN